MCTLSWLTHDKGYEVFFNRDEQRNRPRAKPPGLKKQYNAIMPIDPQGMGTWIATNLHGMTLCLLNNYQMQATMDQEKAYTSRGHLILQLIGLSKIDDIFQQFEKLTLDNYLPFFLCVFPADLCTRNNSIYIYQWDGMQLTQQPIEQPFISSAVLLEKAQHTRKTSFEKIMANDASSQKHLEYHASHIPQKGIFSVCMHRDDARTQSLSHISVNKEIVFRYHDGPPCENKNWLVNKIKKTAN